MENERLQDTIDHIEGNLRTHLTTEELAARAGYSPYHFSRLFTAHMGMPLSAYILSRRLKRALYEIAGGYKAIDVVLEYGFETYAGFYKAFVREYGCSPKRYIAIHGTNREQPKRMEVRGMGISRQQIRELLGNWEISEVEIHNVYYMGGKKVADDVWRIGEDYFLKHRANKQIQCKDIAMAKLIHAQGLEAAMPVLTKAGEEYLDGEVVTILTRRIKGTPYEMLDQFGTDALTYAKESGRAIAKLHRALKHADEDMALNDSDLYKTITGWALPIVRKQNEQWSLGLDEAFFTDYIETFGGLQAALPRQIIHRDPNPGNILFDGGRAVGFIDFDLSERNVRLFDPCYCATGTLGTAETDEEYERWIDISKEIVRGYDAENPLTEEEKRAAFYVMISIQMILTAWLEGNDDPDFKRLFQTNLRMFRFIAANKARLADLF